MRETKFIAQKKEQWKAFETLLALDESDPERLGDLYVQVTDDLSYARTFYPNRSVRVYLNGLAQQLFVKIYKNKPFSLAGLIAFWREELPDLLWHSRKIMGWALLIFGLFFIVGWVSSAMNPDFDKIMLGESYIQMTKENIAKGDPLGVYKGSNEIEMFFQIGSNNLKVDFLTFALGILWGIGAVLVMIYNAIMVGSFQHFFYAYGGFKDSLFTIWVHGAFEISAMILSCAAGMELGKGIVFPGTYSRLQAFQISARRGFKILVGVLLLTVIAAFNESFLTRFTDAPYLLRGAIIFSSLGFVLFYFVYYPYRRYRAGLVKPPKAYSMSPDESKGIAWSTIKSNGEIIKDAIKLLRNNINTIFWVSAIGALLFTLGELVFVGGSLKNVIVFRNWSLVNLFDSNYFFLNIHWKNVTQFWRFYKLPHFFPIASFLFFTIVSTKFQHIIQLEYDKEATSTSFWQFSVKNGKIFLLSIPIALLIGFLWLESVGIGLFLILLPVAFCWQFALLAQTANPFAALGFGFRLIFGNFFDVIVIQFALSILFFLLTLIISSQLFELIVNFIQWNLRLHEGDGYVIMRYALTFMLMFLFGIGTALLAFAGAVQASAFNETVNAASLREQIAHVGLQSDLRGVIRE
ncbi:MAG: hypothetical protein RI894_2313 [Bacteroidota bacterium]|jgi:uncharacterized membrane protein SpoIIM required for sporulation